MKGCQHQKFIITLAVKKAIIAIDATAAENNRISSKLVIAIMQLHTFGCLENPTTCM